MCNRGFKDFSIRKVLGLSQPNISHAPCSHQSKDLRLLQSPTVHPKYMHGEVLSDVMLDSMR